MARPSGDWRPAVSREILILRTRMRDRIRAFFSRRGVLEVDIPILQEGANLDQGVTPMRVMDGSTAAKFLITSPEHPLKRLVAAGYGDVWALCPVFRAGESGRKHAPEFRMLEWYRLGFDDRRLAAEVIELLAETTGLGRASETITYRDAFLAHAGLDPFAATVAELTAILAPGLAEGLAGDRGALLDLVLSERIEPQLGRSRWTILTDYPADQAAQARIRRDAGGRSVAARFEIYREGLELANGYHELQDAGELRQRMQADLASRPDGQDLCLDERYLAAMASGLPDCAGVAVGFDRVVMAMMGGRGGIDGVIIQD